MQQNKFSNFEFSKTNSPKRIQQNEFSNFNSVILIHYVDNSSFDLDHDNFEFSNFNSAILNSAILTIKIKIDKKQKKDHDDDIKKSKRL